MPNEGQTSLGRQLWQFPIEQVTLIFPKSLSLKVACSIKEHYFPKTLDGHRISGGFFSICFLLFVQVLSCILGWDIEVCNHVKVHLYGASIHLIWASIHARSFFVGFKAWGKLHCFNPSKSKTQLAYLSPTWTWCGKIGLGMEAKTRPQFKQHISFIFKCQKFWKVGRGMHKPQWNGTSTRTCPHKWMSSNQ